MKRKLTVIIAVVALALGGFWYFDQSRSETARTNPSVSQPVIEEAPRLSVSEQGKTVGYDGQEGKTALEILRALTSVTTKTSDFGEFVTSINGRAAEDGKEYWAFYVNGTYGSEGAGTYKTAASDKIEWRLEEIER